MLRRRTKIVATLGPATDPPGMVDNLIAAGMDCARLNCSHGNHDDLRTRATEVRAASARAGRPLALLFDLQGPKIRLVNETAPREFSLGERVRFVSEGTGAPGDLEVAFPEFHKLAKEQSNIVIGDGTPRFQVVRVSEAGVEAITSSPGMLGPRKGVNVTHAHSWLPALTSKDYADISLAVEMEADYLALSFVRDASDVQQLRQRLQELDSQARVIAKIEKVEAFENIDSIIAVSDGLMVARGDYGIEAGLAHVPKMQKETINRAVQDGKVVITATQMLESMIYAPEPTRAEALDVHNAVIDGTSAVMLSAETGVGAYPLQAVSMMAEIARVAETSNIYCATHGMHAESADAAVMYAAVALGRDTNAAAIIVPTSSGGTARACAKYRPRRPIIALAHNHRVARQLALEWGVYPAPMPLAEFTDDLLANTLNIAKGLSALQSGDLVVITAGPAVGLAGATNLISLQRLP